MGLRRGRPLVVGAAVGGALLAVAGAAGAVVASMALQAMRAIPDNGFGLCSGGPGTGARGAKALTPWLDDLLNETAGLPRFQPLTFGHLWAGPDRERSLRREPDDRQLQLAMMTTNLTNRCAHQLPWDNREWFFDPAEFRRLFPARVVKWMEDHPPPPRTSSKKEIRESRIRLALMRPLCPLPDPVDLPVLVATRMSLSFPVLLSAVPLWQMDMTREENEVLDRWRSWAGEQDDSWDPLAEEPDEWPDGQPGSRPLAERCWFSDGGISSNFPVHFFDRLVPRWPTFAINLRPFAEGQKRDMTDQANNTWMVKTNNEGIRRWWYRFPGRPRLGVRDRRLAAFLSSVVRTMQNRVDEAQMRVPGYRDRIAHVSMSKTEGGMNLTMPSEDIAALTARGREAAKRLRKAYTPPDPPSKAITWDNHRWIRLRSSLAVLEEMHGRFAEGFSKAPASPKEPTYARLLNRDGEMPPKSYPWQKGQRGLAREEIEAILDGVKATKDREGSVVNGAPNPRPQGRIAPTD
jgi:predicted acylesterase/phospholipase RssA